MPAGPVAMHDATVFNIESFFGWTITAEEWGRALRPQMNADKRG
jgi:hypothetical protein